MKKEEYNQISGKILNAAITVHKCMGPGLLESIYETCLIEELIDCGLKVQSQIGLPLHYKGKLLDKEFRIDILVEDAVIIEVKAVELLMPIHQAQVLSYMKLADKKLGLLINFNAVLLKDGFKRYVHNF